MHFFQVVILLMVFLVAPNAYAGQPVVRLETNMGNITLQLDAAKAPKTVQNFLQYVESGFYNGTIFHRVVRGFVIQGGGLEADMKEKPTQAPIRNEAGNGLHNRKYTIAMARTMDPHSASAQFFINTSNNSSLDFKAETNEGYGYAVFGQVIAGKDVVDKIEKVAVMSRKYYENVPISPIVIRKALVLQK